MESGIEYEQLNKDRQYFRYQSLRFETEGIRLGEELLAYPDSIKEDLRSQEIIRFVLASRVIVDSFTLKRYFKRIADEFKEDAGVFDLLPRGVIYSTAGVFVAELLYPLFKEDVCITFDVLISHLSTERIRVLIKLMEFKSKLAKILEAEIIKSREKDRRVSEKMLESKLLGILLHLIPELKNRESFIAGLLKKELENAFVQFRDNVLRIPEYSKQAKLLIKERDIQDKRSRLTEMPAHYAVGNSKTSVINNFEVIDTDCGIPEIYRGFDSCPFPDVFTPLGEIYIQRCPVNHGEIEEP